jgi:transposase
MSAGQTVTMSTAELDRADLMAKVAARRLTQREAARLLGLSDRHVRRLVTAYEAHGPAGLISRKRGKPSARRVADEARERALALVRERYADFGPTLAHEKLSEHHGLAVSVETLRKWMIADGVWVPRRQRDRRVHQPRQRRSCVGELIQIDGCDHDWFEGRGPRSVLLVFIDDATSRLMELRFYGSECTFSYFTSVQRYLQRHGRPVALYSDKASIFRVNGKEKQSHRLTQFGRAMTELNIDVICANSAPAKGRVERAHLTLQDRLVKELRLADVDTREKANAFLDGGFLERFNDKFGREPTSAHDAHRPLLPDEPLNEIFQWQEERKVSRSLTVNYRRMLYVLLPTPQAKQAQGQRVRIYEDEDGNVSIRHNSVELAARVFAKDGAPPRQSEVVPNKRLAHTLGLIHERQQAAERQRLETARSRRRRRLIAEKLAPN